MTINISVKSDIKQTAKGLRQFRKQIPFATALALTRTAQDVQRAEQQQIKRKLDKPVRFTQNAIGITPAKKFKLVATVFVKRLQARYLRYQIEGGVRKGKGQGTGVPFTRGGVVKLNQYGNVPGRRRKAPLWRQGKTGTRRDFVANINGINGVWRRQGRSRRLRLLIAFEQRVRYRARFFFYRIGKSVVTNVFRRNFQRALAQAIRTRR